MAGRSSSCLASRASFIPVVTASHEPRASTCCPVEGNEWCWRLGLQKRCHVPILLITIAQILTLQADILLYVEELGVYTSLMVRVSNVPLTYQCCFTSVVFMLTQSVFYQPISMESCNGRL